ncbi:MAG: hypothetical protein AB7T63_17110 [Planctomycetota bacterium]
MPRTHRVAPFVLLLAVPFLLAGPGLRRAAADETTSIVETLDAAKEAELTSGDHTRARRLYESLLLPDRRAQLTVQQRTDALTGRARCAKAEGLMPLAEQYWTAILADSEVPDDVRAWAQGELDAWHAASKPSADELVEELGARRRAEDRQRAESLYQRARLALDRNDFDEAWALALDARAQDPTHERIGALIEEIQAGRPDPSRLLPQLLDFIRTRALAERALVRQQVDEALLEGRAAEARGDLAEAARRMTDAVARIDASGFLEVGVARGFASLLERRDHIVTLLEQVHAKAREAGGPELPPIPKEPPPDQRTPGLEGQLYGLLAQLFRAGGEPDAELRFYDLASRSKGKRPTLTSQIPGLIVRQEDGTLSRAQWVQARVADEMGSTWLDPLAPDFEEAEARVERRGQRARLLARFGDVVAIQHKEALHRRVRALVDAFEIDPPAMRAEVHVFGAQGAGVVRIAEALELKASPGAEGFTLLHRDELTETSVGIVGGLEGVKPLGQVRLVFRDGGATSLLLEQRTAEHPMFAGSAPPPPTVPADVATYGVRLDLFVEDMPHAAGGLPRSAVSLRATTRMPTHTTIVPRLADGPDRFQRLPRLGEHAVSADVELPHFGSLVVLGLPNPFPDTQMEYEELVVVIGVRRDDDPLPDTPPPGADPRVVPAGWIHEEHALGALGSIVEDDLLAEGWPEWAPADPPAAWERREARERYLARLLARLAQLLPEGGPAPARLPVAVHQGAAVATLEPSEHARLARAVTRLRERENDLYAIEVLAAAVPDAVAASWASLEGARRSPAGALRLPSEAAATVAAALSASTTGDNLDRLDDRTLARATQAVVLRHVEERSIVRDVDTLEQDGRTRLIPRRDRVAQGLVVEVRPGLEDESGMRDVAVRVRSARWASIERVPVPGGGAAAGLTQDVVRWLQGAGGVVSDRAETDVLADGQALVLVVAKPGSSEDVIATLVRVRKVR